jgi:hypothetical protein
VKSSRAALAVLLNKTLPCPPVASHKLTLVVLGESQPGAFCHNRDTFWQKRQEVTRSVARAPTSVARVTTSAPRATSSATQRQQISGRENRARSASSARAQWARATFRGAKPITRNGRNASHKRTCAYIVPPAEARGRARQPIQCPTSTRAALGARAARAEDPGARGGGKSDQGTIGCALRWTGNSRD